MTFGKVENPDLIDFTLPDTAIGTNNILSNYNKNKESLSIFVGCAKWNKADLKGFYPKGTKDELKYYASQFNAIELNASFYRQFSGEQFKKWKEKTPEGFKFFPKLTQEISHLKRLQDVNDEVNIYLDNALHLEEKLGTIFLQLHNNFDSKNFTNLVKFIESWPKEVSLSIECRHTDWFINPIISHDLYQLLEENLVSNTIVDTAGRRDLLHMRLTNNEAFIRFVGANHPSDYLRLDDWVLRLKEWTALGLKNIHFFIHQNTEEESPLLASYFIEKLNSELNVSLKIPNEKKQMTLF